MQGYVNGSPTGADINAGSAGSGTVSVGSTGNNTLTQLANLQYPYWESIVAGYDGGRTVPLRNEWYEGALEAQGPSTAQCTSLGITGADCAGSIAAAILAWKNDISSNLTQQAYFKQFMGLDSTMVPTFGLMAHSQTPTHLSLECAATWQLLSTCSLGPTSPAWQTYYGFQAYSAN